MARPPQIIAQRPSDTIVAPASNSSLELANALSGVNAELQPVLQQVAKSNLEKQTAKAERDALQTNGAALADAVRSGKLKKTQNPYYIQAYEKAAGAVQGRQQVATLLDESQTWAERTDPAKYQARFAQEMGAIADGYQTPDALQGFFSAANPLAAQAIQQNVQFNVARINQEHEQNISTEVTTNILAANVKAGGKATAQEVFGAIEAKHQEWIATGGSEPEWDNLVINSVVASAFNSGNAELLSVLDDNRGGKGALSNIAGPDGQPVAQSLATARYRIESSAEAAGTRELRARANAIRLEGMNAAQKLWEVFDYKLLTGEVTKGEITETLKGQGVSAQGAAAAIGIIQKDIADNVALSRNLQEMDVNSISTYTEGLRNGYSPAYEEKVAEMVRIGKITSAEGQSWLSTAQSRTNHLESEARSDQRAARSDARAAAAQEKRLTVAQAKALKTSRDQNLGVVAGYMERAGRKLPDKTRKSIAQGAADAEARALLSYPGEYSRAKVAGEAYIAARGRELLGVRTNKPKPSSGGNPNR